MIGITARARREICEEGWKGSQAREVKLEKFTLLVRTCHYLYDIPGLFSCLYNDLIFPFRPETTP